MPPTKNDNTDGKSSKKLSKVSKDKWSTLSDKAQKALAQLLQDLMEEILDDIKKHSVTKQLTKTQQLSLEDVEKALKKLCSPYYRSKTKEKDPDNANDRKK